MSDSGGLHVSACSGDEVATGQRARKTQLDVLAVRASESLRRASEVVVFATRLSSKFSRRAADVLLLCIQV
ncbi:hypothetical protein ACWD4L_39710 [Streptomyces sp. NPDC002596]